LGGTLGSGDYAFPSSFRAVASSPSELVTMDQALPPTEKNEVIAKLRSVKDVARERLVQFLTPDQLAKWDAEIKKAKSFLGVNM
jgi:hypothetical protein